MLIYISLFILNEFEMKSLLEFKLLMERSKGGLLAFLEISYSDFLSLIFLSLGFLLKY
jgi:hypothetical protein